MRRGAIHARRAAAVLAAGALLVTAGCGGTNPGKLAEEANLAHGKQLFVDKCGSCHTLARAGTTGTTGPSLDAAFRQSRLDGFTTGTIAGIVHEQILYPALNGKMPAKLFEGDNAKDVAAYVGRVAGIPGKDAGRLAALGVKKATGTATAKNGTLEIDVAAAGLAYVAKDAKAPGGQLTIESKNPQPTPHDIAIEGNGVNDKGPVVQSGGISKFSANLKPGTYTFYCSVPGHRQGGMVGTLVVQ
jgi:mono/diheme cytochrome c family protein